MQRTSGSVLSIYSIMPVRAVWDAWKTTARQTQSSVTVNREWNATILALVHLWAGGVTFIHLTMQCMYIWQRKVCGPLSAKGTYGDQRTTFGSLLSSFTVDSGDWIWVIRFLWQVLLPTEPLNWPCYLQNEMVNTMALKLFSSKLNLWWPFEPPQDKTKFRIQ